MRKFVIAMVLGLGIFGLTGVAAADYVGPTGSDFDGAHVHCGYAEDSFLLQPVNVYNGQRGLEVCSDNFSQLGALLQARVFVDSNETPPIFLPDRIHADVDADTVLLAHIVDLDLPF